MFSVISHQDFAQNHTTKKIIKITAFRPKYVNKSSKIYNIY